MVYRSETFQNPSFARWLEQPEVYPTRHVHRVQTMYIVPIPGVVHTLCQHRKSSSASGNTKDNTSTARAAGTKRLKVSEDKLRLQRVNRDATSGEKLANLHPVAENQLHERLLRDTECFLASFV